MLLPFQINIISTFIVLVGNEMASCLPSSKKSKRLSILCNLTHKLLRFVINILICNF